MHGKSARTKTVLHALHRQRVSDAPGHRPRPVQQVVRTSHPSGACHDRFVPGFRPAIAGQRTPSAPFDEQVAHWRDKTDAQLDEELTLLKVAKKQWVIASIIGWQAISLVLLGVITHQLWQNDYHLTFSRIVIIFTSWTSILFVMWYIADLFDHSAGFERWLRAFNSRARVTPDADSVECVADALDMTRRYPEVLRYKQEVSSRRELRHEDIINMREMGRLRRYTELLRELDRFDGAPRLVVNS